MKLLKILLFIPCFFWLSCGVTEPINEGCTDEIACNYKPDAEKDDDSCIYAPEFFDCDSNCIEIVDCSGVCNGNAALDNCGVCDADSDNDCLQDCAGIWGGDAVEDSCSVCDNDVGNDCLEDCNGAWGGTHWVSDCGCVSMNNSGDDCDDCTGVPYGSAEIMSYWYDGDSDGLGYGQPSEFCNALVEDGWVLNGDDEDDNCFSNIHNCAGVCDGIYLEDECGICNNQNNNCISQTFELNFGLQSISFNILPQNLDLINIFSPLIENNLLNFVIDENDNMINYDLDNNQWINNIGIMSLTEGYYISINSSQTFEVFGLTPDYPIEIELFANINNLIGYPLNYGQSTMDFFSSIIEEGVLESVVGQGVGLFFNDGYASGSLNYLYPNVAYFVGVNADITLIVNN